MATSRGAGPAALAATLTACSSSSSSSSSPSNSGSQAAGGNVSIRYLTHWGPDQVKQMQSVADAFHKDNPTITITFQAVPFGNLLSTLLTQGPRRTVPRSPASTTCGCQCGHHRSLPGQLR